MLRIELRLMVPKTIVITVIRHPNK
jgi:hypothetical protein